MDDKAITRAALMTLRQAILERFPPREERIAWWGGLSQKNEAFLTYSPYRVRTAKAKLICS